MKKSRPVRQVVVKLSETFIRDVVTQGHMPGQCISGLPKGARLRRIEFHDMGVHAYFEHDTFDECVDGRTPTREVKYAITPAMVQGAAV